MWHNMIEFLKIKINLLLNHVIYRKSNRIPSIKTDVAFYPTNVMEYYATSILVNGIQILSSI
jgi:hypothetical protein